MIKTYHIFFCAYSQCHKMDTIKAIKVETDTSHMTFKNIE